MLSSVRMVNGRLMRRGYTTGSCAAAAAKAAAVMLFAQSPRNTADISTPLGTTLTLDVLNAEYTSEYAYCAVCKDSGDDPDITNGVLVYARVSYAESGLDGIGITGGEGVGRVTKPGLEQAVGEYAINSVPRKMIRAECEAICREYGYTGGLSVVISIPGGEEISKRTFNPKMGIIGGLSILGTTGIVEPMSEAAFAETIRTELNLLFADGKRDVLLTIGNYGEAFARDIMRLSLVSHVKCSNFIGEAFAAAAEIGFHRALLIGHIGKLVKLGIGITNTHSRHGDGRIETITACALEAGADIDLLHKLLDCASTDAAIELLDGANLLDKTTELLKIRIENTARRHVADCIDVGFICFRSMGDNMSPCFSNTAAERMLEDFRI